MFIKEKHEISDCLHPSLCCVSSQHSAGLKSAVCSVKQSLIITETGDLPTATLPVNKNHFSLFVSRWSPLIHPDSSVQSGLINPNILGLLVTGDHQAGLHHCNATNHYLEKTALMDIITSNHPTQIQVYSPPLSLPYSGSFFIISFPSWKVRHRRQNFLFKTVWQNVPLHGLLPHTFRQ